MNNEQCPICECGDMIIAQKRAQKAGGYYVCTRCWRYNDQYGSYGPPDGMSWQDKTPFWIGEVPDESKSGSKSKSGYGSGGGKAPTYKRPVPKQTPYPQPTPNTSPVAPVVAPRPDRVYEILSCVSEQIVIMNNTMNELLQAQIRSERIQSKLIRQEPTLADKFLKAQFDSDSETQPKKQNKIKVPNVEDTNEF